METYLDVCQKRVLMKKLISTRDKYKIINPVIYITVKKQVTKTHSFLQNKASEYTNLPAFRVRFYKKAQTTVVAFKKRFEKKYRWRQSPGLRYHLRRVAVMDIFVKDNRSHDCVRLWSVINEQSLM